LAPYNSDTELIPPEKNPASASAPMLDGLRGRPVADTRGGLGVKGLFAASIGVIVAQIGMVSVLQGIGIGGWGFVAAMVVAFAIALANAMAYAEMALMMPSAGSLSSYAEAAVGNFPAILLVFAGYVTPAIFGLPVELILADQVLSTAIPLRVPAHFWSILLVVIFAALNILGTDVFARVQTTLSFLVLAFLLSTGAIALSGHAFSPAHVDSAALGIASLGKHTVAVGVIALAFWVFMGTEFVTPLVPEARSPERDLPRAMLGGLATIFIAQLMFALGAAFVLPRRWLLASAAPHLEYAIAVFGPAARVGFVVLAVAASASLLNTVFAAVPRMLSGMAENGQVFPIFKRTHRRFGTPVVAILFVAVLPLVGLAWSHGDANAILPLTIAASVSWLLAYMVAQISLMVLRVRHPHMRRPFRVPGYPWVPLLALGGMIYVALESSPSSALTGQIVRYTGVVLGLFAVVGGVWVKFVMRRGLFEPTAPAVADRR
jgi:amino acid transporter